MDNKKKIMRYVIAFITMIMGISLTGCQEKIYDDQGKEEEPPAGEVNDFDFSTKTAVEFTLKYDVPAGYRVHFEMYTTSPLTLDSYKSYVKDTTLIPFMLGRSDENGNVTFKGNLPATVSEIYAYSTAIGAKVPVLMKASVSNGVVSAFAAVEVSATKSTRANGGRASGTNSWQTYNVVTTSPTLPVVSTTITVEDMNLIDKSFPENQDYSKVRSFHIPGIELSKNARVKIYSVKHGINSDRTNALAYFVYKNDEVKPEDVNSNLQVVFPELSKTVPVEGTGYQLLNDGKEVFEAGSSIGFALFPDITPGDLPTTDAHVLYSYFKVGSWNTYTYPGMNKASVPHMVLSLLRKTSDGHAIIAIGFEDQPWDTSFGTNKGNFRDDMFILEVDPASSLPEDLPTPPEEEPAYDDEYSSAGILSFEDCWPHAGDYDINDVVIAYDRRILVSKKLGCVGLKEKFTFLNNGATFTNGFGYQLMGVSQSGVTKCTVQCDQSDYKWAGQGLDATAASNEAIIMLFDDAKMIKKGTTFDVTTYFSASGGGSFLWEVNPFIVVKKENVDNILSKGRTEIHLPTAKRGASNQFLPTSKASLEAFGQYEDKSDIKKGIYYVRGGNYPFALDINWESSKYGPATNYVIPGEVKSIENTYPEFTDWVKGNGKTNLDWFYHPKK